MTMIFPFTTKPTTPGQLLVFVACAAVALLLVGLYLVYLSFGQPAEKLELAMQARSLGFKIIIGSMILGGLSAAGQRWMS